MKAEAHHQQKDASAPSALALCWAMLRRLFILLATPGQDKSIPGLLAELEREICRMLLREALALDPSLQAIDPANLRLIWRNGELDIDVADAPDRHAHLRAWQDAVRAFIRRRELAHLIHRVRTITGHGYRRNPVTMIRIRFERRIARRVTRRDAGLRLGFVASTREPLAGAPP